MTRFIHDQFAKDYLEELLSPYGEIQAPQRVAGETRQSETLWLRVLGRGKVQQQAIDELAALDPDDPLKLTTLELFYQLQENLNINQPIETEDRELIMRLLPLYQEKIAQAEQKGIQQGIQQ